MLLKDFDFAIGTKDDSSDVLSNTKTPSPASSDSVRSGASSSGGSGGSTYDSAVGGDPASLDGGDSSTAGESNTTLAKLQKGVTNTEKLSDSVKEVLKYKNSILDLADDIKSKGMGGVLESMSQGISAGLMATDIGTNLAETIMEYEAMQKLKAIIDTSKAIAAGAIKLTTVLAEMNETVFANTYVKGLINAGADPLYDRKFMDFVYAGDYWKTLEVAYKTSGKLRTELIRRYAMYTYRGLYKGSIDVIWLVNRLKQFNTDEKQQWNTKSVFSNTARRMIRSPICKPPSAYLDDYYQTFKVEPGLYSDDATYSNEVSGYCNAAGYAFTMREINYMLPIVLVDNPITGKKDKYIRPIYVGLVSTLKHLMDGGAFRYPLIHERLEERLRYPIYNEFLHERLMQELRELLIALGLEEIIPMIVTRDMVLSKYLEYFEPDVLKKRRTLHGYHK
jgi:hypothetical protein